jgi:rubrerythrin
VAAANRSCPWSLGAYKDTPGPANLLYEALETEQGGIKIYETAVSAAVNEDLKEEWEEYLDQTRNHEAILRDVFEAFSLDPSSRRRDGRWSGRSARPSSPRWRWR